MTRAKDISKILTDADISGNIDVDGVTNLDVVDIDGALTQDGGAVFNEASADVDFRVESNNDTHALFINGANANIGLGTASPDASLHIEPPTGTTNASLLLSNSGRTQYFRIQNNESSDALTINANDSSERIRILSNGKIGLSSTTVSSDSQVSIGGGNLELTTAGAKYWIPRASDGVITGSLYSPSGSAIRLSGAGTGNGSLEFEPSSSSGVAMTIDNSGRLLVGLTSPSGSASSVLQARGTGASAVVFDRTNDGVVVGFKRNGGNDVGNISIDSSSTAYSTSSDYRLKENVVTEWDATSRLKQLKPSRFNFKIDADTTVDGFLAHEVSSIVPEAISGTKDGTEDITNVVLNADGTVNTSGVSQADWTAGKLSTTDEQGNTVDPIYASNTTWVASKTIPVYQGIDQSKLVPLLVKTIQELEARITALEGA